MQTESSQKKSVFQTEQLIELEPRYRAKLVNSLSGFKSLVLVGTRSSRGNNNLALFSSLFHISANPAMCGMLIRPKKVGENTLGNILESGVYTLNHLREEFYREAHQTSARYPQGVSEFEEVGLHPTFIDPYFAPFVEESSIRIACELLEHQELKWNQTHLIIGKIVYIEIPEKTLNPDGYVDIEAAGSITCSSLDSYHTTQRLARLEYAKPGIPPHLLE